MFFVVLIIWFTFLNDVDYFVTLCFVLYIIVCMIFEVLSKCNFVIYMCRDDGKDEEICYLMSFVYF